MKASWLTKKVKYGTEVSETFIEHAIKTYQVGKYLYEKIAPTEFEEEKYLFGCFFHDIGKIVASPGEPHTPKTKDGFASIVNTQEYGVIADAFGFGNLAADDDVIHSMQRHHDSEDALSAYISIADQIASSQNDENLKNRLKEFPISTLITYLNEMHGFSDYHFYHVRFYSFSKNELNAVGRLLLLKLLYESIEQMPDVRLLYETFDGCRVATKLDSMSLKEALSTVFTRNLAKFVDEQNLDSVLGGAPDNYGQFCNMPREAKSKLVEITVEKYARDILRSLKKKDIKNLEDVGLNSRVLLNFARLDEICNLAKKGVKGTSNTKYYLFADEKGKFPTWVVDTFFQDKKTNLKRRICDSSIPLLEKFLSKAGADVSSITCKDEVYRRLFALAVAVSSLMGSTADFCFDMKDYLAIDDEVPLTGIAKANPCANCGVFEGEVELTPFVFEYKQHAKETVLKQTEKEFRDREKVICGLCQIEGILNVLLCGTGLEGMQARVSTQTHLIICGLGIGETLFGDLIGDEPIKRLMDRFLITGRSIYAKKRDDFQFLLMSIKDFETESRNPIIQHLLFSLLSSRLEKHCLVLALGVNKIPTAVNDSVIQFKDGDIQIIDDVRTDFFDYVCFSSGLPLNRQRDMVLEYLGKPFIGIAQIFKRNRSYDNHTEELIQKVSKEDELFTITDQIWEMAKIGGALEVRKNVGSFLAGFNGTAKSVDLLANRLLKNSLLSAERRSQIIETHEKLRGILEKMNDKQRAQLRDYVQKTKYLFNSKKFYELRKRGELRNEQGK
jgi:hypothetical protein